jgi:hypothetical protein
MDEPGFYMIGKIERIEDNVEMQCSILNFQFKAKVKSEKRFQLGSVSSAFSPH